jgi:hypothetical protein
MITHKWIIWLCSNKILFTKIGANLPTSVPDTNTGKFFFGTTLGKSRTGTEKV